MRTGQFIVVVLIILGLAVGYSFINTRNRLVALDESVNSAWAEIDNQLKRRSELIPNYVETVKGYAGHEKAVFAAIADSSHRLDTARGPAEKMKAEKKVSSGVSVLLNLVVKYPELKANHSFMALQAELEGTQNRIAVATKRYNEAVKVFNREIRAFPNSMIARFLNFTPRKYFQVREEEKRAPKIRM